MLCNRRHLRLILCKHVYGIFSAKIHLRLLAGKTSLYLRFIDVIILKQTKEGKNLVNFLNDRNTKHASIKFAFNYSTEKIRCCSNTRMVTFRPHFTEIWLITKILALNIQTSLGTKKECSLQSGAIRKSYLLNSNWSNWIHKNTLRHLKMHLRTYGTNRKILERKLRKLRKRKEKYFK